MINWENIFKELNIFYEGKKAPSVTYFSEKYKNPFFVLISTIISLRTKDNVTIQASNKLFKKAPNIFLLSKLPENEIASLIYPAGFYKVKAKNILAISKIIINKYSEEVPNTQEDLLELPGVGLKTANLVLSLAFNKNYICVDIHVHRIANRMGWINTKSPDDSEIELKKIFPEEYWIKINTLLVLFGQEICRPISPYCSNCFLYNNCKRINVKKTR